MLSPEQWMKLNKVGIGMWGWRRLEACGRCPASGGRRFNQNLGVGEPITGTSFFP